jgi:hypothetical protein
MKAEAMASALSRALLGGKHAQSMWVKAEQSNLIETSAGWAMVGVIAASRDSAAAITHFIITSHVRNPVTNAFMKISVPFPGSPMRYFARPAPRWPAAAAPGERPSNDHKQLIFNPKSGI